VDIGANGWGCSRRKLMKWRSKFDEEYAHTCITIIELMGFEIIGRLTYMKVRRYIAEDGSWD